jgi:hypothetical protein
MALALTGNPQSYYRSLPLLKKLFWAYFLLLIFEGALRKWVVPQLSAPLLVIRDPIAIMIIWQAYRTQKFPQRWTMMVAALTVLMVGLFALQIMIGGNPLIVGIYGLRSYLLPFPVLFIMGDNLDEEDLRQLGRCTLWLLLPMTLLDLAQYAAPPGSFLNAGAYEGGAQIGYIGAHLRASGTFSFAIGVVHFCALAAAFILYGLVSNGFAKSWMLWAGAGAVILSVPTTGARTLLAELGLMLICVGIGAAMGLSQFGKLLRIVVPVAIAFLLVSQVPVFSDAMKSMTERVTGADTAEGGDAQTAILYRTIGPAFDTLEESVLSGNWLGTGIGSVSSAMAALVGESVWSDNELERELIEMGPIAGMAYLLFRVALTITLFGLAMARAREQEPLALLMLPVAISTLFFGTPEQPTVQGFMVISAAFCLAASKATNAPGLSMSATAVRGTLTGYVPATRRRLSSPIAPR